MNVSEHSALPLSKPKRQRWETLYGIPQLRIAVAKSHSYCEAIRKWTGKAKGSGGGLKEIKRLIAKYNISTAHFPPIHLRMSISGERNWSRKGPLAHDVLQNNSGWDRTAVRRALSIVSPSTHCVICGTTNWCGKPLVFQMDHLDGNNKNHSCENLRWLCPNCHSQTNTFAGKNRRNITTLSLPDDHLLELNKTLSVPQIAIQYSNSAAHLYRRLRVLRHVSTQ